MDWFDDVNVDPQQFDAAGGLYGRLRSMLPEQSFNVPVQGSPFPPVSAGTSASVSGGGPLGGRLGAGPQGAASGGSPQSSPSWPRDDGQTLNMRIGDYWMPQFGRAEPSSPAAIPAFGDRLNAGFQSWAHTPLGNPFAALANGMTGFGTGQQVVDRTSRPAARSTDDDQRSSIPWKPIGAARPRPLVNLWKRSR